MPLLWALHIPDQVLHSWWWILGWIGAILWVSLASRGIEDEEIPRVGLFSAVFFLGTLFHIPFFGVHLLLPGVMGLFLGNRAILAILVAILLQAGMGHGGFTTAGINTLIMAVPACLSWWLVLPLIKRLKAHSVVLGTLGFMLGFCPVALAVFLHAVALYYGGVVELTTPILLSLPLHLPVAIAEGIFLATALPFLASAGIPPFSHEEQLSPAREQTPSSEEPNTSTPSSGMTPILCLILGATAFLNPPISAFEAFHNLKIDWKILSGGQLEVEAYFERGEVFKRGELILKDSKGAEILRESRHQSGRFVVKLPPSRDAIDLYIQADDHVAHSSIPAKALEAIASESGQKANSPHSMETGHKAHELAHSEPGKEMNWRDLVTGLSLILSICAFWMAWRAMGKTARGK